MVERVGPGKNRRAEIKARSVTARRRREAADPGMVMDHQSGRWIHWEEGAERLRAIRRLLEDGESEIVVAARQAGESWSRIAICLGVNPEVLRRRYVSPREDT